MKSRLNWVQNWKERAERANYNARTLAIHCQVSLRQLERYFVKTTGHSPQRWLNELRQQRAAEMLCQGRVIKDVMEAVGFKQQGHFSREFKRHHGFCPSRVGEDSCCATCRASICRRQRADVAPR